MRVFSVALTEAADFQLLQSVAQVTEGAYFRVLTSEELPGVLDRIGTQIATPIPAAATAVAPQGPGAAGAPSPEATPQARWFSMPRGWALWLWLGVLLLGGFGFLLIIVAIFLRMRSSGNRRAADAPLPAAMLCDTGDYTGTQSHPLMKAVYRIGRIPGFNDLVLPYDSITKQHAVIEFRDGYFRLRDLRSTNGTYVNSERLGDDERVLKHGDRVCFHTCEFEFVIDALVEEQATTFFERPKLN
jgi:hypothetical protein